MTTFASTDSEAEIIEKVRGIFRAYVPESDAWKDPSFFNINSIVVGGLTWSALNEARNGIDKRVNPATAVGQYLDQIAARPPLLLTRAPATQSSGFISIMGSSLTSIPAGYTFTTSNGITYTVDATTALTAGDGVVAVTSQGYGEAQNSPTNQPMVTTDGDAISQGIYGGFEVECDAQLRRRIFAAQARLCAFGSGPWYQNQMASIDGVTRSWMIQDGGVPTIVFLMEDKYPCGEPLEQDLADIAAFFEDECKVSLCFCPAFCPAKSLTLAPEICWEVAPDNTCDVIDDLEAWLRANKGLGDGVTSNELQCFLSDAYPHLGPKIKACEEYKADCKSVYNCVELIGPC